MFVRRQSWLVAILGSILVVGCAMAADSDGWTELFNGHDFTGWTAHLDSGGKLADTWTFEDGVIHCAGMPRGYIQTDKDYGNFVLEVDWRWPDAELPTGNSGILVRKTEDTSSVGIWPKSIEIQLKKNDAGEFWTIDESIDVENPAERVNNRQRKKLTNDKVEKPLGQWNHIEITCQGDTIDVKVNGVRVNHGTQATATKGKICLQSEGTPIEFRNVRVKPL